MSTQDETTSTGTNSAERLIGRVKWFNNKAGFGFITVTDGDRSGADVFVHHSSINVENTQQYKYLVQGEYVEFRLVSTQNESHEFQSADVSGIKGGKLMCETRHDFKLARTNYKQTHSSTQNQESSRDSVRMPRQQRAPTPVTPRRQGASSSKNNDGDDNKGWSLVKNSRPDTRETGGRGRGRGRPPKSSQ